MSKKVHNAYIYASENRVNDLKTLIEKDNSWKKYKDKNLYNCLMIAITKNNTQCAKIIIDKIEGKELIEGMYIIIIIIIIKY